MAEENHISRTRTPGRGVLKGFRNEPSPRLNKKVTIKWARDVKIEQVSWLWYPYIPYNKLTMLSGDPGIGKSFISDAIAAAVSSGDPLPGQGISRIGPAKVLMFVGEDDLGDTIKPRLISLNANIDNIALVDDNLRLDDDGLATISQLMDESQARLFIIDPIVAYLGAKLDMNRSNEVRPMLKGLADIASKHHAAGLIVRHLRKASTNGQKTKSIYMGMGSIDFTAAVRSELHAEEAKNGKKYLNHVKSNIGPKGKSIVYVIDDDIFEWGEIMTWDEMPKQEIRVSRTFLLEDRARLMIHDLLKDEPDGLPSNDVYMRGKAMGISERTMKAAKSGMVLVEKDGKGWRWKLNPLAKRPTLDDEDEEDTIHG